MCGQSYVTPTRLKLFPLANIGGGIHVCHWHQTSQDIQKCVCVTDISHCVQALTGQGVVSLDQGGWSEWTQITGSDEKQVVLI